MINLLPPPREESIISSKSNLPRREYREGRESQLDLGYRPYYPETLDGVIKQFGSFPEYSVILGQCLDGMPLMLDLSSPRPGSLLVYNASDEDTVDVVNTICQSTSRINSSEDAVVCMVSDDPDEYLGLMSYPNCQAILAPYERTAGGMVYELAAIAEQRRYGRENGPAVLLVIDDLYSFLSHNTDYGVFVNFKWLINYGPGSMIWPVISIRNSSASKFTQSLTSLFPFQITAGRESRQMLPSPDRHLIPDRLNGLSLLQARYGSSRYVFYPLQV